VSAVPQTKKSQRRRSARFVDLEEAREVAAADDGHDAELASRLERAVDELPEMYRTPLIMHDLEGYTHAAIADALSIAEGTSKTRVAHARAKLRDTLTALRDQ